MDADGIKLIQDTAVEATQLTKIEIKDPRSLYFFNNKGEIKTVAIPTPPRAHSVLTVEDFIAAAKRASGAWAGDPVIWHNDKFLQLQINDQDRLDNVKMDLTKSPLFKIVEGLVGLPRKTQGEFIELLKVNLGDAVVDGATLLTNVRTIRFKSSRDSGSDLQSARGRESMDLSISREAYNIVGLPDKVQLTIPVYANPGEIDQEQPFSLMCSLDLDLEGERFIFTPIHGEIEAVVRQAQASIRARIVAALPDVPIFNGSP